MIDYPLIAQRLEHGEFRAAIAREIGVNTTTLYVALKKLGLPTSCTTLRAAPTPYEAQVLRLSQAGLSVTKIARALETSKPAIRTALWKAKKKMGTVRT